MSGNGMPISTCFSSSLCHFSKIVYVNLHYDYAHQKSVFSSKRLAVHHKCIKGKCMQLLFTIIHVICAHFLFFRYLEAKTRWISGIFMKDWFE
ncbi:hypothetical protein L6452_23224 [Arctium lappa]|uniref:Uncharacterized protein n=1 Tax=Arctium lappa TaxID=4217 RepID=A0ACB9B1S3_ARCLA|nr:hypothetical protein L6452_23224 [Arctium lappa]